MLYLMEFNNRYFPIPYPFNYSSKIKIEDSTINKILLIFSVESYGSGITNQGIINMIKLKNYSLYF